MLNATGEREIERLIKQVWDSLEPGEKYRFDKMMEEIKKHILEYLKGGS